jgi:outer membrane protein assembly factor BamE (lipoprotein component of BamABCDE complex)
MDTTILLLLLANSPGPANSPISGIAASAVVMGQKPDTSKATRLKGWPDDRDIARLESAKGQPSWKVLLILGHPSYVERKGEFETWYYPWNASCSVWFKDGICKGSFYTAGY